MHHICCGFYIAGSTGDFSTRRARLIEIKEDNKMKKSLKICMITLALALLASPLQADKGKILFEDKCTRCHSTELFTREDRSVKNLEVLKTRVKVCSIAAEAEWLTIRLVSLLII